MPNQSVPTTTAVQIGNYLYQGTGAEGTSVTIGALIGFTILLIFKGDKLLAGTTGTPGVDEYKFNASTGKIDFGNDIENGQLIQILNKA